MAGPYGQWPELASEMACKGEDYSEFLICQLGLTEAVRQLSVCEQRNAALVRMTLERREEERLRAWKFGFGCCGREGPGG